MNLPHCPLRWNTPYLRLVPWLVYRQSFQKSVMRAKLFFKQAECQLRQLVVVSSVICQMDYCNIKQVCSWKHTRDAFFFSWLVLYHAQAMASVIWSICCFLIVTIYKIQVGENGWNWGQINSQHLCCKNIFSVHSQSSLICEMVEYSPCHCKMYHWSTLYNVLSVCHLCLNVIKNTECASIPPISWSWETALACLVREFKRGEKQNGRSNLRKITVKRMFNPPGNMAGAAKLLTSDHTISDRLLNC